jgi:hypothetical protein
MTNALRSQISNLASSFATALLTAIRGASLEDILNETKSTSEAPRRGPGRPRGPTSKAQAPKLPAAKAPARKGPARKVKGRLARRSPGDIAKALEKVVALVKSNKAGLRSEQIRAKLGMDKKEMPRVLKEGLDKKVLKSKGQKRSTTYSAA